MTVNQPLWDDAALDWLTTNSLERDYWLAHADQNLLVIQASFDPTAYIDFELRFHQPGWVFLPTAFSRHVRIRRPTASEAAPYFALIPQTLSLDFSFYIYNHPQSGLVTADRLELRMGDAPNWIEWQDLSLDQQVHQALSQPVPNENEPLDWPEEYLLDALRHAPAQDAWLARVLLELDDRYHPWLKIICQWLLSLPDLGPLTRARIQDLLPELVV